MHIKEAGCEGLYTGHMPICIGNLTTTDMVNMSNRQQPHRVKIISSRPPMGLQ